MIIRLSELEKLMRPQFVFDKTSDRKMQTLEQYEGTKELARMIFVGLADMCGFESSQITEYLDMGYDTYRNKLSNFREYYKESIARIESGRTVHSFDDSLKKFYIKTCLCLNAIKFKTQANSYSRLYEHLQ